ncbi:hypothetical protein AX774_g7187 [Zancudomyces culisetae]|uniref:CCHC-type domain-containing protein n=1 Tax=Zancudomyces culisetae TaxID=1213189 RepID=A0A1R1PEQ2_ZANCU|nr:hypothetical protein AX774_g7187 [Zancudomyces culisetae]|eukprot:OMH79398.1 hypothetical protein AX774_g7187 [Zancudomyces culisetae]
MAPIPHNLDELIQTTSEIENRIIAFNNYTNNSNYNIRNSNTPRNTYFSHGHKRFGQIKNEPEAMEVDSIEVKHGKTTSNNSRTCFKCGKKGHYIAQCKAKVTDLKGDIQN